MFPASAVPRIAAACAGALCMAASALAAPTLRADSYFDTAGNTLSTTFSVSGLGNHAAPSLGAFEFDFLFDPDRIAVDRVLFGEQLGSPDVRRFTNAGGTLQVDVTGAGEALADARFDGDGRLHLSLVSLLETSAATCVFCVGPFLEDLQGESFSIAAVTFTGRIPIVNANATSYRFALENIAVSDGFGQALAIDVVFHPAPAPATAWLAAAALVSGLLARARRGRRGQAHAPKDAGARPAMQDVAGT